MEGHMSGISAFSLFVRSCQFLSGYDAWSHGNSTLSSSAAASLVLDTDKSVNDTATGITPKWTYGGIRNSGLMLQ
jgi:hypothetical protein